MKLDSLFQLCEHARKASRLLALVSIAGVLGACGGGGYSSTAADTKAVFMSNPRALPAEYLARKAVAYSPYRSSKRETETITAQMVEEDLDLLVQGNFKLIRLFDSSDKVAKLVLDTIADKNLDIKVQLGAYVIPTKYKLQSGRVIEYNPYNIEANKAANEAELNRAIALATNAKYRSIVLAVSVGNETLVDWSTVPMDANELAAYIKKVRDAVTQPVTTDDNFAAFVNPAPKPVVDQIDFLAIHLYPNIDSEYPDSAYYWDWKQLSVPAGPARAKAMMDASITELRRQYAMVRTAIDSMGLHAMPIAITETGWKAFDSQAPKQVQRAHPVNQKMFYERLDVLRAQGRAGAGPVNIFYFEAFDEPWKAGDDGWGLFSVARKARYVVQNFYSSALWDNNRISDANAVYYEPPAIQSPLNSATAYALYSDTPGVVATTTLRIDAFEGNSVTRNDSFADAQPGQGAVSMRLTPAPKDWGWGLLWQPTARLDHETPPAYYKNVNLSGFASGRMNFWIKTTYPGKLEFGLSSLTATGDVVEVLLPVGSGEYGYKNDGTWTEVNIPLSVFVNKNPKLDLRFVVNPFYIADRYAFTGKASQSAITSPIQIDSVQWNP